jgi:RimJ/RimL family protein N-acetyltransferase
MRFLLYDWPGDRSPPAFPVSAVRRLTMDDLTALQDMGEPWLWKHFGSARRLLEWSHAVGRLVDGRLASVAAVFGFSPTLEDIAVVSRPRFRRRGWATDCTRAIIADTLARGRYPTWKAQSDNEASQRVAERAGFINPTEFTAWRV